MADTLFIRGLRADCIIGRAEWERMVRQTVELDLDLRCDLRRAAEADEVVEGVPDTRALSKRLQAFIEGSSYRMIEALAEGCARILLDEFPIERVRLRLAKPGALRGARSVGVVLVRSRPPAERALA